ncbi:hypothetical protein SESI111939_05125 [Serratia silvae]
MLSAAVRSWPAHAHGGGYTAPPVLQFSLHPERGVEVAASWSALVLLLMRKEHPLAERQVVLADLCEYLNQTLSCEERAIGEKFGI